MGSPYAPDGGLYMPVEIPRFTYSEIDAMRGRSLQERAFLINQKLLNDEYNLQALGRITMRAFSHPIPTVKLASGLYVCERFHGLTDAFKDEGIGQLAGCDEEEYRENPRITIKLCNSSGDTAGAGARAYANVNGVWCILVYPAGRVSPFQEYDIAGTGAPNITAVRSGKDFDWNDELLSRVLKDPELSHIPLSTVNSKNLGRLLPQVIAFFEAYFAVTADNEDADVVFCVEFGNGGHLVAAVIARLMGLPICDLVAACNINSPLPEYLSTGVYTPKTSVETLSTAMDIGNPSNWERLLSLLDGNWRKMEAEIVAYSITDEEVVHTIKRHYAEPDAYLVEAHTAVGLTAAARYRDEHAGDDTIIVTMATARPTKFGKTISDILGFEPPVRESAANWRSVPLRVTELPTGDYDEFRDIILNVYAHASRSLATGRSAR